MKYNKSENKGQAALEFIMTYGWAMILLMAMIAGLIYIMPHPKSLLTGKCLFGSAIPCVGAQLSSNNLTIVLTNEMGQSIYNISASTIMPGIVSCQVSNISIRTDERLTIVCNNTGSNSMNVSSDSRIKIELKYQKVKGGYNQSIIGEIYAKYT